MEYDRRPHHSSMNGVHRPPEMHHHHHSDKKRRNYKLIVDPTIHSYQGNQKVYRFDGINPDGRVIEARDPRPRYQRIWCRRQAADLPVPQFKYDHHYVGTPPPKEVTFTNLNDNINKDFLENMCKGFGTIEESRIYYHPKTKKHLGIGKVVYSSSKAAKACVEKLNRTSKMGNIMNVFVDTFGKERAKLIEEKLVERPKIDIGGLSKRDRSNSYRKSFSKDAYDPADSEFDYNGGSSSSGRYQYPPSEGGYTSHSSEIGHAGEMGNPSDMGHSSDMSYSAGTPFSQSTYTPGSMYGGDMHSQGYTPASDAGYSHHHHQTPHSHHHHHHHHHQHHHSQQHYQQSSRYDMPPPPSHPPPPFVNFDPKVPPPPLPSETHPPIATPNSHYQSTPQQPINTPDYYHQERDHSHKRDHDRHRSRHHDRDYEQDRDRDRDRDYEHDRHRNSHDHHERTADSEGPKSRDRGRNSQRLDNGDKPAPPPPKPVEKEPRPPTPEPEQEEPRFMSLESRIQSLLRAGAIEEEDTNHSNRSQEVAHATPSTPHTPSTPSDGRLHQNNDTSRFGFSGRDSSWPQTASSSTVDNGQLHSNAPQSSGKGEEGSGSDMDVDDDDDRMSLSSISSGEERLQVNPPVSANLNSSGMGPFPHNLNSWQTPTSAPFNYNFSGSGPSGSSGPFGPGFNPANSNGLMDQTAQLEADLKQQEEETQKQDRKFALVLNSFVKELKAVMQKDLCKKMVEVSAFKALESWYDAEAQKTKQQPAKPVVQPEKPAKPAVKSVTDGMSSAIASLFESRHPWTKDGGLDNSYNFGGFSGGGLLGIRGGMPRLPSFKKKFHTTQAAEEDARKPKEEKTGDDAGEADDAESDREQEKDKSEKAAPGTRRVIYSSDSDEESDDEKEASAVEDEEEEEEEDEEEEEEEEESDEDSEEDEEEEEEESGVSAAESSEEEEEDDAEVDDDELKTDDKAEKKEVVQKKDTDEKVCMDEESAEEKAEELEVRKEDKKKKEESSEADSDVDIEADEEEPSSPVPSPISKKGKDDKKADQTETESTKVSDLANTSASPKRSLSPIVEEKEEDGLVEKDSAKVKSERESDAEGTSSDVAKTEEGEIGSKVENDNEKVLSESEAKADVGPKAEDREDGEIKEEEMEEGEIKDTEEGEIKDSEDVEVKNIEEKAAKQEVEEKSQVPQSPVPATPGKAKGKGRGRPRKKSVQSPAFSTDLSTTTDLTTDSEQSKEVTEEETSGMEVDMLEQSTTTEKEDWSYVNPAIAEHDYSMATSVKKKPVSFDDRDSEQTDSADEQVSDLYHAVWIEHSYCLPIPKDDVTGVSLVTGKKQTPAPVSSPAPQPAPETPSPTKPTKPKKSKKEHAVVSESPPVVEVGTKKGKKEGKGQGRPKKEKLTDITNKGSRELSQLLPEVVRPKSPVTFEPRSIQEERQVFFDIYNKGIDDEDINYLKRTYDELMQSEDPMFYWLNDILWVDHPFTNIPDPPRKRRKVEDFYQNRTHKTGSARTDGYFKITLEEKARYLSQARNVFLATESFQEEMDDSKKKSQTSREVRSETRRLQSTFSEYLDMGDLFKFNHLKTRKKLLKFAKSGIHDWGLFALEPILADEMVIEYVGSVVRQSVADLREKQYEQSGIGSSYLFRVDHETIIDATMVGNLARFINHSCNPNCYAKIITMESQKKIVIYSKRDIDVNEEITYDYKFPIEDQKIPCMCGTPQCRGTLN